MFDVNVFGPMRLVHHFHDMLIRASGTIVNIGSVGGIVPYIYGCMCSLQVCGQDSPRQPLTMPARLLSITGPTHSVSRWLL